jgi:glycosyltransferase involved in cell wall biosynthesis
MLISVIVPTFNEEKVIKESYRRLANVFINNNLPDYELIFINDGSRDKTMFFMREIALKDEHVKLLNFSRNFGHQAAVTAGLKECKGDVAVIIDADLQDPPEVILDMLKVFEKEECNVVYGVRNKRKGESFFKLLTAKMFYRLLNSLSDISFPVDTGDFRLIDRKVIDAFNNLHEKNKYIRGLISWLGFKQCPVYYNREARFAGETKYPFSKMLKFASIGLFYFSKKPLKLATSVGFTSIFAGLLIALWLLISQIFGLGHTVSGWTSTIIIIIFFGGVQLLTIGVLGQYIGSLFDEVKNRPEYIIAEKVNFNE